MAGYRAKTATGILTAVILAVALGSYLSFIYPAEPTQAASGGVTISIQVVNGTASPVVGMTIVAGPVTSPSDIGITPDGWTPLECIHQVPNGSLVENNGSVLFPDGTLVTFPPCPLKQYVTDSSGSVLIENSTSEYYFIRAGNLQQQSAFVIGVKGTSTVNVTVPWPSGNATITAAKSSANCIVSRQLVSPSGIQVLYMTCS